MKVISAVNVNDALLRGIDLFQSSVNYRTQSSRNGDTMSATLRSLPLTASLGSEFCLTKSEMLIRSFIYMNRFGC